MSQANRERLEKVTQERKALAANLREDNFDHDVPKEVTDAVFAKAWEDGHASGLSEVAMHYEEIAEIAAAAFVAGKRA